MTPLQKETLEREALGKAELACDVPLGAGYHGRLWASVAAALLSARAEESAFMTAMHLGMKEPAYKTARVRDLLEIADELEKGTY